MTFGRWEACCNVQALVCTQDTTNNKKGNQKAKEGKET